MKDKRKENLEDKLLNDFVKSEIKKNESGKFELPFTIHLNEKDKIRALDILKRELIDADLTSLKLSPELVAGVLKSACISIEDAIEDAIEFAILKNEIRLKDSRKNLLIGQAKLLNELKGVYEKKLIDIDFPRNNKEETEFKAAFDFELDPPQVKNTIEDTDLLTLFNKAQNLSNKQKETVKDFLSAFVLKADLTKKLTQ